MVAFATQVKRRRGTTAQNDAFTGAEGEIVVDTQKHTLRVHDGETQGGFEMATQADLDNKADTSYVDGLLATKANTDLGNIPTNYDYVVESQTADNGYTWYRKYKSGWVEQGGIVFPTTSTPTRVPVTLPITMGNTVYSVQVTGGDNIADAGVFSYYTNRTTTGFEILHSHTTSSYTIGDSWQVSGMSAQ